MYIYKYVNRNLFLFECQYVVVFSSKCFCTFLIFVRAVFAN